MLEFTCLFILVNNIPVFLLGQRIFVGRIDINQPVRVRVLRFGIAFCIAHGLVAPAFMRRDLVGVSSVGQRGRSLGDFFRKLFRAVDPRHVLDRRQAPAENG